MTKTLQFVLPFVLFILFTYRMQAQTSTIKLGISKSPVGQEKTFLEIQKDFEKYWEPYNVKDGYYIENGERKKALGWKQFRRWEWYWNNRVDPTTGKFPDKRASDSYTKRNSSKGDRSPTGAWIGLGPSSTSGGYNGLGRLNCVAFRPGDNNTIYVGSPAGGLWKTTNGGSNWNPLTDNNAVLGVSDAIVIAGTTTSSDIIYIGTGDRDGGSMWTLGGGQWNDNNSVGVLKSTDGGVSWSSTGLTFSTSQKETVNRMLKDPGNDNIIYTATSNGLYHTSDAGVNWTLLNTEEFVDIELKPGSAQTIYGSTRTGKIYRSTDGGSTWSIVLDEYSAGGRRINLAVTTDDNSYVYAVVTNQNEE